MPQNNDYHGYINLRCPLVDRSNYARNKGGSWGVKVERCVTNALLSLKHDHFCFCNLKYVLIMFNHITTQEKRSFYPMS